jgi:hypothetical protein
MNRHREQMLDLPGRAAEVIGKGLPSSREILSGVK